MNLKSEGNASIVGASRGPRQAARQNSGAWAEQQAAQFLRTQGLVLLKRNHRCRQGEVDLICRQGELMIFVEVRQRNPGSYVNAAESIDVFKQRRIRHAALHFLQSLGHLPPCRFDVVLLEHGQIQWIQNAME
jgi:putative endonuclease